MDKRICFLYTETNGLHKTSDDITKKNLFNFARLVVLNYEIGTVNNGEYTVEQNIKQIIIVSYIFHMFSYFYLYI
jgi:hypothetical protein